MLRSHGSHSKLGSSVARDWLIGSLCNFAVDISGPMPTDVGGSLGDPATSREIGFSERQFSLTTRFPDDQSCDGRCYSSHVLMSLETRMVASRRMPQEIWVLRLAIWRWSFLGHVFIWWSYVTLYLNKIHAKSYVIHSRLGSNPILRWPLLLIRSIDVPPNLHASISRNAPSNVGTQLSNLATIMSGSHFTEVESNVHILLSPLLSPSSALPLLVLSRTMSSHKSA